MGHAWAVGGDAFLAPLSPPPVTCAAPTRFLRVMARHEEWLKIGRRWVLVGHNIPIYRHETMSLCLAINSFTFILTSLYPEP